MSDKTKSQLFQFIGGAIGSLIGLLILHWIGIITIHFDFLTR